MTTLQPIRDALEARIAELKLATDDQARLRREVASLQQALRDGHRLELKVTDHALLRYAERVLGFDRAEVVALIRDKVGPAALWIGDGKFPLCPGFHAVVQNRAVVTIEPAGAFDAALAMKPARAARSA